MRKILTVFVIALALIVLAFWSPWQSWNFHWTNIFGIESREQFSGLNVKAFSGTLDVYLDGELVGQAEEEGGFLVVFPVNPGEHTVKLSRPENEGFYTDFERKLNFEKAVDVVIGYDLGPSDLFSEGHVLTARKSYTKDQNPNLDIISDITDINVKLDGKDIGKTPLRSIPVDVNSTHILNFEKAGFDTLEIEIFPAEQSDRNKLKDLTLTLEVKLFAKPIEVTTQ